MRQIIGWILAGILVNTCFAAAAGLSPVHQQGRKTIEFIQSYRYETGPADIPKHRFVEHEFLLKTLLRLFFGFSSQGIMHFSTGWITYLEKVGASRGPWTVFLMLSDRMVRNIAYVPSHYEIDIQTGEADDLPDDLKEK